MYAVLRQGDGICIVAAWLGMFGSLPMLLFPDNLYAVCLGGVACSGFLMPVSYRSLLFRQFNQPGQRKLALRVFNFSDVLGYSTGSLVGGLLFESYSFGAFAIFQVVAFALLALMCMTISQARSRTLSDCALGGAVVHAWTGGVTD